MRILAALALSASLLTGACTGPDGRIDPGPTLALTAGIAALGGIAYLATRDNDRPRYRGGHGGGYGGGGYGGRGYGGGGYGGGGYGGGGHGGHYRR